LRRYIMTYADMLTGDGQMVLIGLVTAPFTVPGGPFVLSQKSMRGRAVQVDKIKICVEIACDF
jgi:D-arabinose 1-dehydrogenase-like Zn-dependent alcohol dehydrogenase